MKRLASALALASLVATGTAVAKPGDVYLFGHYTHANLNGADSLYGDEGYTGTESTKQQHNRFGFGAGYVLDNTWAFELGYKDLGSFKGQYADESSAFSENGEAKISSHALVLRSIATLPITDAFKLEGSVGLALTRAKLTTNDYDSAGYNESYEERRTSLTPTLGLGASYAFTDNVALFGRYEYIHNAVASKLLSNDEEYIGTIHASTFDLGLRYTF